MSRVFSECLSRNQSTVPTEVIREYEQNMRPSKGLTFELIDAPYITYTKCYTKCFHCTYKLTDQFFYRRD